MSRRILPDKLEQHLQGLHEINSPNHRSVVAATIAVVKVNPQKLALALNHCSGKRRELTRVKDVRESNVTPRLGRSISLIASSVVPRFDSRLKERGSLGLYSILTLMRGL